MARTIISIDDADKLWLDARAKRLGRSMTDLVREAVKRFREANERLEPSFDSLLEQTRGTWQQEDGLAYQKKLRGEWPAK